MKHLVHKYGMFLFLLQMLTSGQRDEIPVAGAVDTGAVDVKVSIATTAEIFSVI